MLVLGATSSGISRRGIVEQRRQFRRESRRSNQQRFTGRATDREVRTRRMRLREVDNDLGAASAAARSSVTRTSRRPMPASSPASCPSDVLVVDATAPQTRSSIGNFGGGTDQRATHAARRRQ